MPKHLTAAQLTQFRTEGYVFPFRAVLRGCQRSYHYAADHPDEWIAFGAEHFGMTRETMKSSIAREASGLHCDGEIDMRGLQQAIDLQVRLGAIKQSLCAEDIVDLRFLPAPHAQPVRAALG